MYIFNILMLLLSSSEFNQALHCMRPKIAQFVCEIYAILIGYSLGNRVFGIY